MKKYLLFLLLLATLVLFAGCQSTSGDKTNADASNVTVTTQSTVTTQPTATTQPTVTTQPTDQSSVTQPAGKPKLNANEISSVTIKMFTSLNGGPKQKNIIDRALINEMVLYWNAIELNNKTERPMPGTTLSVVFNSDMVFSICSGYLWYDGNYYEQPAELEEQFKTYYVLAKEEETPIEF